MEKADPATEVKAVLNLIRKSPEGIGVPAITAQTDISGARVRYIVQRAYAKGEIDRRACGLYAAKKKTAPTVTVSDSVLKIISRSRQGITLTSLREISGLDDKKLSNSIYRLTSQVKIKSISRGVYLAVKRNR